MSQLDEFTGRLRCLLDADAVVREPLLDLRNRLRAGPVRTKTFPASANRNALRACFSDFIRLNARNRCVLDVHALARRLGGADALLGTLRAVLPETEPTPNDAPIPDRRIADCVAALLAGVDLSYADAGARFFNDSKSLRPGTPLHQAVGARLKQELNLDGSTEDAFLHCGVYVNPTAVRAMVFAPIVYTKGGRRRAWIRELWEAGEPAIVHLDHLRGVDRLELDPVVPVHSCENESPFYNLVKCREVDAIVYTEGYPNTAVCRLVELLRPPAIRHWGDTDVDGWRIAAQFHRIAPVEPWRCTLADAARLADSLRPMDRVKRARAREILLKDPGFPFRAELEFAVNRGWLEQESWHA